jgi:hypothetical protein
MSQDILETEEEISRMFPNIRKPVGLDEELAFFMHKFNLDWETVEVMPAFQQHVKPPQKQEKKNIL